MPTIFVTLVEKASKYIVVMLVGAVIAGYLVHHYDSAAYTKLQLAQVEANLKAVQEAKDLQAKQDKAAIDAAVAEAKAQQDIAANQNQIRQELPNYVSSHTTCVTYGIVRLLNAALGRYDLSLPTPAGKPNDACAPITADQFTGDVIDNYILAVENAEQLNALEAEIRTATSLAAAPSSQK